MLGASEDADEELAVVFLGTGRAEGEKSIWCMIFRAVFYHAKVRRLVLTAHKPS